MILDPNGMPILQPTIDNAETATFNDAFAAVGNAVVAVENVRQIQTYKWADNAARTAQTGMVAGDEGYQTDTGAAYRYDGAAWVLVADATQTVTVTPANSVDWSSVQARLTGTRVFIQGTVSRTSDITVSLVGGTLPVGLRPATDFLFAAAAMSGGFTPSFCGVIITSNGEIKLNAPTATAENARYVGLNCSYEAQ